jgi:hypothetical protein
VDLETNDGFEVHKLASFLLSVETSFPSPLMDSKAAAIWIEFLFFKGPAHEVDADRHPFFKA